MGDSNNPLSFVEKLGGSQVDDESIFKLMSFVNDNALFDSDLHEESYTWLNCRFGDALIQVKLDLALLSHEWVAHFSCSLSTLTRLG